PREMLPTPPLDALLRKPGRMITAQTNPEDTRKRAKPQAGAHARQHNTSRKDCGLDNTTPRVLPMS
ncbi:MAG: hypothetical protein PHQ91_09070, partial [Thermoanaerobaculaceae bacterium]|nr:hypothetical protein [Thermoanaerobaculaceae bacterium]